MHEASIAQSIVRTVIKEAKKQNAKKIESVEVEIGDLTFLGIEQLEFWVKNSFNGTIAENANINFKRIKGKLYCNNCGYEGELSIVKDTLYHIQIPKFSCPECRSSEVEITQGKEAVIRKIKILK